MSMPAYILGPLEALERCLLLGPFHLGSLAQGALCPGGRASFGLRGSAFALLDAGARPYKAHNLRVHEGEALIPHRLFPRSRTISGSPGDSSACHSVWRMAWVKWRRELLFSKSGRAHFLSPTRNVRCSTHVGLFSADGCRWMDTCLFSSRTLCSLAYAVSEPHIERKEQEVNGKGACKCKASSDKAERCRTESIECRPAQGCARADAEIVEA